MNLKVLDRKCLYNVKSKKVDDKLYTRAYIDPFNMTFEEFAYVMENSCGQYSVPTDKEGVSIPQFICPNGVVCAEVIDIIKNINSCGYKKGIRCAEEDLLLYTDMYYDTVKVLDKNTGKYSEPEFVTKFMIEFNNNDKCIQPEDIKDLRKIEKAALKFKEKNSAQKGN